MFYTAFHGRQSNLPQFPTLSLSSLYFAQGALISPSGKSDCDDPLELAFAQGARVVGSADAAGRDGS